MPNPGEGKIDCSMVAGRLHQAVSAAYPLKIISPDAAAYSTGHPAEAGRLQPAVSYILSYGGGIVHGDHIHVDARCGQGCVLLLLTQGSTKVFRHRSGRPPSYLARKLLGGRHGYDASKLDCGQSYQTMLVQVEPGAMVCVLPDPVTCFSDASYNQRQSITLQAASSSLVLLDWMTSGRMSRGERWQFAKYFSVNLVYGPGGIVVRDALLLQKADADFTRRLSDIDAFAYLLVLGPRATTIAQAFRKEHHEQRIRPFRPTHIVDETDIHWSVSEVSEGAVLGVAVRVAGPTTDAVRQWIKKRIAPIQFIVGEAAWSMYFNS